MSLENLLTVVNIEDFAKRIHILLNYYEISAALLAEKIDVQRSSISHILSGRNKPSLDFVLKILKAFPEVELYWLLNGVGNFPKEAKKKVIDSPPSIGNQNDTVLKKDYEKPAKISNEQEIDRIVIFYKDGTFKNYNP